MNIRLERIDATSCIKNLSNLGELAIYCGNKDKQKSESVEINSNYAILS